MIRQSGCGLKHDPRPPCSLPTQGVLLARSAEATARQKNIQPFFVASQRNCCIICVTRTQNELAPPRSLFSSPQMTPPLPLPPHTPHHTTHQRHHRHTMPQVLRTWSSRMLAQNQGIPWLTCPASPLGRRPSYSSAKVGSVFVGATR